MNIKPDAWIDTQDLELMREKGRGAIVWHHKQDGYAQTALYAATQPQPVAAEGVTESVAKAIYQQWKELLGFRPWEERGNSLMQDKARDLARAALSGTGSDESNA